MSLVRRTVAGLVFVLAPVVFLLSLAGAVGVWVVKGPVAEKATRTFGKAESALNLAAEGLGQARASLDRAAEGLGQAREEQRARAGEPRRGPNLSRMIARSVSPEIAEAGGKLHAVAEAAVVVNTILDDVGNVPFLSTAGLDLDQLKQVNEQLARVGPAAWDLSRRLGESGNAPGPAAADELSQVERSVAAVRGLLAEQEPRVAAARGRTETVKATVFRWLTPVAVLVTALCVWVAFSQISLLAHAWQWWKGSR
jgi:hypothetical protein